MGERASWWPIISLNALPDGSGDGQSCRRHAHTFLGLLAQIKSSRPGREGRLPIPVAVQPRFLGAGCEEARLQPPGAWPVLCNIALAEYTILK